MHNTSSPRAVLPTEGSDHNRALSGSCFARNSTGYKSRWEALILSLLGPTNNPRHCDRTKNQIRTLLGEGRDDPCQRVPDAHCRTRTGGAPAGR